MQALQLNACVILLLAGEAIDQQRIKILESGADNLLFLKADNTCLAYGRKTPLARLPC